MPVKSLNPYLNFGGSAAQAIKLYERALGAKVEQQMKFGDVPGMDMPAEAKERVMHAHLIIDGNALPLQDTFWGAKFGMLVDAFNINWMFNCELKPSK